MALIQCRFFSDVLGLSTTMHVILPEQSTRLIGMDTEQQTSEPDVLYLLHGLSDDDSIWTRRSSLERYAAQYNVAIIMPNGFRGYYTDTAIGQNYWTYITEELPAKVHSFYKLPTAREKTHIAGLSMGGYGAFKAALRLPERFASAASLSGALDMYPHMSNKEDPVRHQEIKQIFGAQEHFQNSNNDLFACLERLTQSKATAPRLYQCCGTEDMLYADNIAFKKACSTTAIDYTYKESAGGHTWEYWDNEIQHVLQWMFQQNN